jgi:hypothetical protein
MRYAGLILLIALTATGCNRKQAELTKALAEAQAAEAHKDSLLTEVLETTQFVSYLNSDPGPRGAQGYPGTYSAGHCPPQGERSQVDGYRDPGQECQKPEREIAGADRHL